MDALSSGCSIFKLNYSIAHFYSFSNANLVCRFVLVPFSLKKSFINPYNNSWKRKKKKKNEKKKKKKKKIRKRKNLHTAFRL